MNKVSNARTWLIMDLQYGSTGKGLLAGKLALDEQPEVVVCAWTPNAGHTFIGNDGNAMVHRAIPNGVISPRCKAVMLGPNSVIDAQRVIDELEAFRASVLFQQRSTAVGPLHVVIHPSAMLLRQGHRDWEEKHLRHNGSTRKGSAAAQIEKMQRQMDPVTVGQLAGLYRSHGIGALAVAMDGDPEAMGAFAELMTRYDHRTEGDIVLHVSEGIYQGYLDGLHRVQVEGAQGFSLSLNGPFYPYCTGRDVTPAQIAADCALPMRMVRDMYIIGTMRTFPIRVNNREGSSGSVYRDQREITWESLGVEPELTTVTKLPRRIFTLSRQQLIDAAQACAPDAIFLNFCNYVRMREETTERDRQELNELIDSVEEHTRARVLWRGWGPTLSDVEVVS